MSSKSRSRAPSQVIHEATATDAPLPPPLIKTHTPTTNGTTVNSSGQQQHVPSHPSQPSQHQPPEYAQYRPPSPLMRSNQVPPTATQPPTHSPLLPPHTPPILSQRSKQLRHQPTNSLDQYERLMTAEDEEDDDDGDDDGGEEDGGGGYEEEEDGYESDDMLNEVNEEIASSMYPPIWNMDGELNLEQPQMTLEEDAFFPVHHTMNEIDDNDEVLVADSGTNTPMHSGRDRRRMSGQYAQYQQPAFYDSPSPVQPAPGALSQHHPLRTSSTLRRFTQVEQPYGHHSGAMNMPPMIHAPGLGGPPSRPMSADMERRSLDRMSPHPFYSPSPALPQPPPAAPISNMAIAVAPATAAPPSSTNIRGTRQPFHQFGNGPVAAKPGPASPPILPPVGGRHKPTAAAPVIMPALVNSPQQTPRPASPSGRFDPTLAASAASPPQLAQSKNSFVQRGGGAGRNQQAPATVHALPSAVHHIPPRSDFPDFPSMQPTPLPGPFSAAPSQPLALLSVPGGLFELPPGYEIVRKLPQQMPSPGPASRRRRAPTPTINEEQKQGDGSESAHSNAGPSSNPYLQRALADVLKRMAKNYGLPQPTSTSSTDASSSMIVIEDDSSARRHQPNSNGVLDESVDNIAEGSISFTDVEAVSRPTSAVKERRMVPKPVAPATTAPPNPSTAHPAVPAFNKEKLKGVSSFLQDVFDEIEIEGGTPRDARTPADTQNLSIDGTNGVVNFPSSTNVSTSIKKPELIIPTSTTASTMDVISLSDSSLSPNALNQLSPSHQPPLTADGKTNEASSPLAAIKERGRTQVNSDSSPTRAPIGKHKAWGTKKSKEIPPYVDDLPVPSESTKHAARSKKAASKKHASTAVITASLPNSPPSGGNSSYSHKNHFRPSISGNVKESYVASSVVLSKKKRSKDKDKEQHDSSSITPNEPTPSSKDKPSPLPLPQVSPLPSPSSDSGLNPASSFDKPMKKKKLRSKKSSSSKSKRAKFPPPSINLEKTILAAQIRCLTVAKDEVWTCEKDGVIVIRDAIKGETVENGRCAELGSNFSSIIYAAGYIYAGTTSGQLVRINRETRKIFDGDSVSASTSGAVASTSRSFSSSINILVWDGKDRIFGGCQDHILRAWNAETGQFLRAFRGHTLDIRAIHCMSFNVVWTGGSDFTIRIWDVDSGECLSVLTGHTGAVTCLISVGWFMVSGSADGTLRIWKRAGHPTSTAPNTDRHAPNSGRPSASPSVHDSHSVPSNWECTQVVEGGVGHISALLRINSNQIWSVGQSDHISVWSIASDSGLLRHVENLDRTDGHTSFITGVSFIRRKEIRNIWSFSCSSSSEDSKLCLWSFIQDNGKDVYQQLQDTRQSVLALQQRYKKIHGELWRERIAFQKEVPNLIMVAAQERVLTLEANHELAELKKLLLSKERKMKEVSDTLANLQEEHQTLKSAHEALEIHKVEQAELHEEYSISLKKVIADSNRRKDQLELNITDLRRENDEYEAKLDAEVERTRTAEERITELESLVTHLRAESLQTHQSLHESELTRESLSKEVAHLKEAPPSDSSSGLLSRIAALELENQALKKAGMKQDLDGREARLKMDHLARELDQLHTTIKQVRTNLVDNVTRPLKGITPSNLFQVQSEVNTAAVNLQLDITKLTKTIDTIMHTHLSVEQKLHIGMSTSSSKSKPTEYLSPSEREHRDTQMALEISLRDQ